MRTARASACARLRGLQTFARETDNPGTPNAAVCVFRDGPRLEHDKPVRLSAARAPLWWFVPDGPFPAQSGVRRAEPPKRKAGAAATEGASASLRLLSTCSSCRLHVPCALHAARAHNRSSHACFSRAADEPAADRRVRRNPVRRASSLASLRVAASAAHAAAG